jgi:tellurite resistance protein
MTTVKARLPLNTFAIPLGLTGLAEAWSDAGAALDLPIVLSEAFWVIAAVVWIWMIVAHVARGAHSEANFASQLMHPAQGPIAAIMPIIGMLVGINLHQFWLVGGTVLIIVSIAAAALYASWFLAFWLRGGLSLESVHGGYFLPTVAASFVAGGAASVIGYSYLATAAFTVGSFFWLMMFALVAARLAFRTPLPDPLAPTMAILMAPPAVGGLSFFAYNGGRLDVVEQGLLGIAVILVLVQLVFLRRYGRLAFTLGFWSFAFPSAFMAAFVILFISKAPFAGWQIVAWLLLAIVTVLIVSIAVVSIRLYFRGRASATTDVEVALAVADAAVTPTPTRPRGDSDEPARFPSLTDGK